jgi:hypothetical protein
LCMKLRSHWFTICLMTCGAVAAGATTIVAIRTSNYVILGTDSRVNAFDFKTGSPTPGLGCKIRQIGQLFVGTDGIIAGKNFNAYQIAAEAAAKGGGTVAIADRFEGMVKAPFETMLGALRREDFANYCDQRECLQVAFAGFDGGSPTLAIRRFTTERTAEGVRVSALPHIDCPSSACAGDGDAIVLGVHDHADRLMDSPNFGAKGSVASIDDLIDSEIKGHPESVGPPVAILVLSKNGGKWAPEHQGVCTDLKQQDHKRRRTYRARTAHNNWLANFSAS